MKIYKIFPLSCKWRAFSCFSVVFKKNASNSECQDLYKCTHICENNVTRALDLEMALHEFS